jgi:hypothetical protein
MQHTNPSIELQKQEERSDKETRREAKRKNTNILKQGLQRSGGGIFGQYNSGRLQLSSTALIPRIPCNAQALPHCGEEAKLASASSFPKAPLFYSTLVQRPYFQAQNLLVRLSWPKNLNSRTYYSSAKEDTDLGLENFKK